ncbi:hypothetical protein D3C78_855950 [compost metagenome]
MQFGGQFGIGGSCAHIDHRRHGDALFLQVEGGEVAVVVAGEHHRTVARLHGVEFHQALRGAGQHDSRQVVVAEHHRLVERARGHQAAGRAHLVHALVLDHRQVVFGEPGVAGGFLEHLDVRVGFDGGHQFGAQLAGTHALDVEARVVQRSAEHRLLLHQQNAGSGIGGIQRGAQAGGAGADDRQVDEQIGLVVVLRPEVQVEHAESGLLADQRLPDLPHAFRFVEGTVVEAHRHELRDLAEPGVAVAVERAAEVLSADIKAGTKLLGVGQHVGFVRQLHQGVGVLPGHAQRAARAVVLERAREQPAAVGEQGAGDTVAGEALEVAAVEGKAHGLLTVDQQAHGGGEAVHPAISWAVAEAAKSMRRSKISFGSKVRTIWSVTVWRSARNQ